MFHIIDYRPVAFPWNPGIFDSQVSNLQLTFYYQLTISRKVSVYQFVVFQLILNLNFQTYVLHLSVGHLNVLEI